jgi:hypothetical protein
MVGPHPTEARGIYMQLPEACENVALEYYDVWLGKSEVLIAHRQMNKWIDTRSGKPLKEYGRTMYAVRWWPLVAAAGILCMPTA